MRDRLVLTGKGETMVDPSIALTGKQNILSRHDLCLPVSLDRWSRSQLTLAGKAKVLGEAPFEPHR